MIAYRAFNNSNRLNQNRLPHQTSRHQCYVHPRAVTRLLSQSLWQHQTRAFVLLGVLNKYATDRLVHFACSTYRYPTLSVIRHFSQDAISAIGFLDNSCRAFLYLFTFIVPSTMISLIISDTRSEFCAPNFPNTDKQDYTNDYIKSRWLNWHTKQKNTE
ncbi:hypothetical protein GGS24DRAFT_109404 [Hypoxylon argillaceum]|nr:hypothetical protein GGS24DRAFT_109404 [Hypoxylon argillaceum]